MTLALTFGFYLLIHKTIQHKVKKKYRSAYIFGREQRHSPPIQYYPAQFCVYNSLCNSNFSNPVKNRHSVSICIGCYIIVPFYQSPIFSLES